MKLLAIDTAMAACSVAVFEQAHELPLAHALQAMERGHAEVLAPMVKAVMAEAGVAFAALDRIVVTRGPGTFTGLRIGLAMARGLGLSLNLPVIGLDSLTAIAARRRQSDGPLLVTAEARRDEVYAALFDGEGGILAAPALLSTAECLQLLPEGPVTLLGTAAERLIAGCSRSDLIHGREGDLPDAAGFGSLGFAGPDPKAMPEPLYLRPPDARPRISLASAGPHHAPLLAAIHGECFGQPWTATDFTALLATPGAAASLASSASELLSFLITRRAADEAEIITIATRPAARRRGIATTLLTAAIRDLAAAGVSRLFLEVASGNAAARGFYESHGFTEVGLRPAYYNRGAALREDAIVMAKDMKP